MWRMYLVTYGGENGEWLRFEEQSAIQKPKSKEYHMHEDGKYRE